MSKYRRPEEPSNHEAWAIPYADLMTLLLAFFVVMYAISSVNEGKYQHMAHALSLAFGGSAQTAQPIAREIGATPLGHTAITRPAIINIQQPATFKAKAEQSDKKVNSQQLARISQRLERALAPLLRKGLISIWRNEHWVEVEINSDILFATGSAVLDKDARSILGRLAAVLRDEPNKVQVEGHTDNVPIATAVYPSNWELSAARAASVVHLFADHGLQPQRLAMLGYGEFHPRADNAQTQGRNRNRRVAVIVLADTAAGDNAELAQATPFDYVDINPIEIEQSAKSPISAIRQGPA